MAILDQRKTVANLTKKGFEEQPGGAHRAFNYVTIDGHRSSITTHVSRSPHHKNIPDALLTQMARQCKVPKSDFVRFAQCHIDQSSYEALLRAQKLL